MDRFRDDARTVLVKEIKEVIAFLARSCTRTSGPVSHQASAGWETNIRPFGTQPADLGDALGNPYHHSHETRVYVTIVEQVTALQLGPAGPRPPRGAPAKALGP